MGFQKNYANENRIIIFKIYISILLKTQSPQRFFEIIEELTGKNIFHFIEGNQNKFPPVKFNIEDKTFYLNINKDYFDKHYKEEQLKNLVKKGFFSLICEPFKEEKQKY